MISMKKKLLKMNPAQYFDQICSQLLAQNPQVKMGKMMSAPGIQYQGKNFAFFWKDEMTFKLGKQFDAVGNGILEVKHLSPFKTKPPLTAWYIISYDQKELWEPLAQMALDNMMSGS